MKESLRRKITPLNAVYVLFITAEIAIFIAFNVLTATQPDDPVFVKYSGILLCLAVAAATIYFNKRDAVVLTCALAFTALSDFFIFVLDAYYEVGVTTFFIAQSFYLYRLYSDRLRKIYATLIVRAVLAAVAITVLAVCAEMNYLLAIVSLYFVMLAVNCAEAFTLCRNGFKNALFAVGLLLFICCDVCVGLHNFGSALGVELPKGFQNFAQYAMWIFYLPSQVCITCSAQKGGIKLGKGEKNEGVQTV